MRQRVLTSGRQPGPRPTSPGPGGTQPSQHPGHIDTPRSHSPRGGAARAPYATVWASAAALSSAGVVLAWLHGLETSSSWEAPSFGRGCERRPRDSLVARASVYHVLRPSSKMTSRTQDYDLALMTHRDI